MKKNKSLTCLILVILVLGSIGGIHKTRHHLLAGLYEGLILATQQKNNSLTYLLLALGAPASPYPEMIGYDYYNSEAFEPPLKFAVENGEFSVAKALLKNGANVNWCCCACETALHVAIKKKNIEMVGMLLEAGADTHQIYNLEMDALELASRHSTKEIEELIRVHNKPISPSADAPANF
jgi:ankyrin repeat protein